MPYADPDKKRKWEATHRAERSARFLEERRLAKRPLGGLPLGRSELKRILGREPQAETVEALNE